MPFRVFAPYGALLLVFGVLIWHWLRHTPRRLTPLRRRVLLTCRLGILILLAAAVMRLALAQLSERVNVVFVLDASQSIAASAQQQAVAFMQRLSQHKQSHDGVGVVVFGTDAVVEHGVAPSMSLTEVTSQVDRTGTNIARALQVGMASFPAEGARRLVLLSDGNENAGNASEAAVMARALGVEVFVLPLGRPAQEPEVRVDKLIVPPHLKAGMPYQVEAVIFSTLTTPASLELVRDGALIHRLDVTLQPGKNRYQFPPQTSAEGVQLYQLVVNSPRDTIPENNRLHAFAEIVGRPKVLLVYDPPASPSPLAAALQQQGFDLQTRPWQELPQTLSGYLDYEALIFDNVPSFGISVSQMDTLERYVRDMGGGLLMVGGEKSFGAGGYYRTPMEKILPVDMDIPTKMSLPSLCLVMVIDRSDSMGGSISGSQSSGRLEERTSKMEVAKIAAFSAMKLLNPFDQTGVLAFNADWEWAVPITEAGKRDQIAGKLAELKPAGGTDLYKALLEGVRALKEVRSVKKHLLALSDGLTPNMDFEALIQDATAHQITISAVALGKDADRTLMDALAHWGRGRSYYTDDPLYVPRIFTTETILVSRGLLEEQTFQATVQTEHPILTGLPMAAAPALHGYVVTYGKPSAEVVLTTPKGEPLLAVQRYGLGHTAAFTADLAQRWGKDWVQWPHFSRFAAQLMRWVQRQGGAERIEVQVDTRDGQATVQTDVYDAQDHYLKQLDFQGSRVLLPNRQTLPVTLRAIAPGRYQGHFPLQGHGDYLLTLVGRQGETTLGPKTVGLTLPYAAEYLGLDINYRLLNLLTKQTGGTILRAEAPDEAIEALWTARSQQHTALHEYWPWCVLLALGLFVLDIALRQVTFPAAWTARWQRQSPQPSPDVPVYTYHDLEAIVHRRAEDQRRRSTGLRDARPMASTSHDAPR